MQLVDQLTADAEPHYEIEQELYKKYEVKRGLRDLDGKGVRAGLTTISKVSATQIVDGREVPAAGQLLYRGIPIEQLVQGFITHDRFGFEEIVYLLLMGHLPKADQLAQFKGLLTDYQELPNHFNSGVIMKMPSDNIMNTMAKCVLALHAYDPKPDDTSLPNVMRQCIQLVSQFPSLAVFGYQAASAMSVWKRAESCTRPPPADNARRRLSGVAVPLPRPPPCRFSVSSLPAL